MLAEKMSILIYFFVFLPISTFSQKARIIPPNQNKSTLP